MTPGAARRPRRLPLHHRRPDPRARRCDDLRALAPDEARSARPSCGATAIPAYTTSVGWLGYDDDKIRRLCREALAEGWTRFKMKVGADVADDVRRAPDHPRGDRAGARCWRSTRTSAGTCGEAIALDGASSRSSTRTGSRSRPARTTSSATRRSPAPSRRSGVATGEHVHNRVMFKQLLQADAIAICQIDACRLGGVNEVLAVLLHGGRVRRAGLPARRRRRAVRARPAPVGGRLHRDQRLARRAG